MMSVFMALSDFIYSYAECRSLNVVLLNVVGPFLLKTKEPYSQLFILFATY